MTNAFRDRDFLVTDGGVIFEVTDCVHGKDYVTAFPRYIPFDVIPIKLWGHTWHIRDREYSRFDIRVTATSEIEDTLRQFYAAYPQFTPRTDHRPNAVRVPIESIIEHVTPEQSLQRLRSLPAPDKLQAAALQFADFCIGLGIPQECLGVAYSLMFDAHTIGFSDIDFVIYGGRHYHTVIEALRSPRCHPSICFPTVDEWKRRYGAYAVKDMPLTPHVYALHKVRKYEEISFDGHKLSLIAVRNDEAPPVVAQTTPVGPLSISGLVVDASEGIFRPSIYRIQRAPEDGIADRGAGVLTIINHRREYIAQVRTGERILAFGLASRAHDESLVLELGSTALRGRDFLVVEALK